MSRFEFPFPAIIGQEKVKRALLVNVVNPKIGGVLMAGEKGTAKSTLVRGLAAISGNMQVIDLPLNSTEDRIVGTIDIQKTLMDGKRNFESGIFKRAHENILYVDEVNLLSEHIVNILLGTASSGINKVEREGISYAHPSEFVLVGTMNEEEGLLRSQFLDRFGLYVEVTGSKDLVERKEIIKRRLSYETSPLNFIKMWEREMYCLSQQIEEAKDFLHRVKVSENVMVLAVQIVESANCAGHRAELVIIETARAMAALEKRTNIIIKDIKEAAEYALPHRKRDTPKEPQAPQMPEEDEQDQEPQEENQEQQGQQESNPGEQDEKEEPESPQDQDIESQENNDPDPHLQNNQENDQTSVDKIDEIGRTFVVRNLHIRTVDRKKRKGEGKRAKTKTNSNKGQYVRNSLPKERIQDIAFDATLRAAAPFQTHRENKGLAIAIERSDFREKQREKRTGSTILFIVDASGSMGAKKRMSAVKGAVVSLLTDAYQKRDQVGLVAFRKNEAETILQITRSVDLAQKCLHALPTGGKTPLAAGLLKGYEIMKTARKKKPEILPIIVLVSDGRTNVSLQEGDAFQDAIEMAKKVKEEGIQSIVVDTENDFIKLGLAKEIAQALDAKYFKLEELEGDGLADTVREYSR